LKNLINILYILIALSLSSCGTNKNFTLQKMAIKKHTTKLYTLEEYKLIYQKEIKYHDEATYIGLTVNQLELLNKSFQSATSKEINNDIAYNREPLKLDNKYLNSIDFLRDNRNIINLSAHLKYKMKNIKSIVYRDDKAIISYIKPAGSYESFLIFIDKKIVKIKLIDYLYI